MSTGSGCNASIELVKSELAKKGFYRPWKQSYYNPPRIGKPRVIIDRKKIGDEFYDFPPGRQIAVTFVLGEIEGLFSSPMYMTKLASSIMAECTDVGLVNYAYWWEGPPASVGYFADGTAREFKVICTQCEPKVPLEPYTQGNKIKWGYTNSPY